MFQLKELLKIQKAFSDTLNSNPTPQQYCFAMNIEISEFLNALPWKWWKKNQFADKANILDELSDVIAFWLSWYNVYFTNYRLLRYSTDEEKNQDIEKMIENLEYYLNNVKKPKDCPLQYDISYPDGNSLHNITFSGANMARLISLAMWYTDCSILDVIEAYKLKMGINYERQATNY